MFGVTGSEEEVVTEEEIRMMVSVGEESGSLDEVLEKTAAFYETEADDAIQKMVSILEPVMILVMGGVVGTVIIGIMMPMFGMYSQVENAT